MFAKGGLLRLLKEGGKRYEIDIYKIYKSRIEYRYVIYLCRFYMQVLDRCDADICKIAE